MENTIVRALKRQREMGFLMGKFFGGCGAAWWVAARTVLRSVRRRSSSDVLSAFFGFRMGLMLLFVTFVTFFGPLYPNIAIRQFKMSRGNSLRDVTLYAAS